MKWFAINKYAAQHTFCALSKSCYKSDKLINQIRRFHYLKCYLLAASKRPVKNDDVEISTNTTTTKKKKSKKEKTEEKVNGNEQDENKSTKESKKKKELTIEEYEPCIKELARLAKANLDLKDLKNGNLRSLLADPEFLMCAYAKIKSNPGNMSKGTDKETLDGIDGKWFFETASKIDKGTFEFRPARKVEIPKPKGGFRMLAVASPRDKIVQEAMRMILEIVFEPSFIDNSHGFRPNRRCHSALLQIQKTFHDIDYFVEGDISKCFDSFSHDYLMDLIKSRITDSRFIGLMQNALTVGYVDLKFKTDLSVGTPQGSIMSPLLCNIYMNKVDQQLNKYQEESRKSKKKKRIEFVRYADDILIGVSGNEADCFELRQELADYLKSISLTLSIEKTKVTNARQNHALFVGTKIKTHPNGHVELFAPIEEVIKKLEKKKFLKEGNPIAQDAFLELDERTILKKYIAITRGILQYYHFPNNYHELYTLLYEKMRISLLATMASKLKLTDEEMMEKFGNDIEFNDQVKDKKGQSYDRSIAFKKDIFASELQPIHYEKKDFLKLLDLADKNSMILKTKSLLASQCQVCEEKKVERVHHVRLIRPIGSDATLANRADSKIAR